MKKMTRGVSLLAAVPLLLACSDSLAPDIDFLEVSVSVSKSAISPGEVTELRATLTNPTGRDLVFTIGGCILVFELRDSGDDRFIEPVVCDDTAFERVLEPGESLERTLLFDGTGWLTPSGPAPVPPGLSRVRAGMSFAFINPSPFVDLRILSGTP